MKRFFIFKNYSASISLFILFGLSFKGNSQSITGASSATITPGVNTTGITGTASTTGVTGAASTTITTIIPGVNTTGITGAASTTITPGANTTGITGAASTTGVTGAASTTGVTGAASTTITPGVNTTGITGTASTTITPGANTTGVTGADIVSSILSPDTLVDSLTLNEYFNNLKGRVRIIIDDNFFVNAKKDETYSLYKIFSELALRNNLYFESLINGKYTSAPYTFLEKVYGISQITDKITADLVIKYIEKFNNNSIDKIWIDNNIIHVPILPMKILKDEANRPLPNYYYKINLPDSTLGVLIKDSQLNFKDSLTLSIAEVKALQETNKIPSNVKFDNAISSPKYLQKLPSDYEILIDSLKSLVDDFRLDFNRIKNKISLQKSPDLMEVSLINTSDDPKNKCQSTTPTNLLNIELKTQLALIKEENVREYYVLDVFSENNDQLMHGDKVKRVIESILREYSLPEWWKNKIKYISVNCLDKTQKKRSLQILRDLHGEKFSKDKVLSEFYNWLTKQEPLTNESVNIYTVDEYVRLVLTGCINKSPDVISSSVFFKSSKNFLLPAITDIPPTKMNFVVAVDNQDLPISVFKKNLPLPDGTSIYTEPIWTSLTDYTKSCSILVGAELNQGTSFCSFSDPEAKYYVTSLGRGCWVDDLNPIDPVNKTGGKLINGASFAAPDIATRLFIARAFWRENQVNSVNTGLETRRRMLLASEINKTFVGKFLSAGQTNINKLLRTKPGFLEINSVLVDTKKVDGKITIIDKDGDPFTYRFSLTDSGDKFISSLQWKNNNLYIFINSKLAWEEIDLSKISSIDINTDYFENSGNNPTSFNKENLLMLNSFHIALLSNVQP